MQTPTLFDQFTQAGLANVLDNIWDFIRFSAVAGVLAVIGLVVAVWRGHVGRWIYFGCGAAVAFTANVSAFLCVALITDKRLALSIAAGVYALVPVMLYVINKFAKGSLPIGLTRAAILAHYYLQVEQLCAEARRDDATPAQCTAINHQISELRKELSSVRMGRVISTHTALAMVAPTFYQTYPRGLALENGKQLMEQLMRKWQARKGPQELML